MNGLSSVTSLTDERCSYKEIIEYGDSSSENNHLSDNPAVLNRGMTKPNKFDLNFDQQYAEDKI